MAIEAKQRVLLLTLVPQLLRELGAELEPVLAASGLEPGLLESPANFISFVTGGRLLRECVAATGCDHFGLLLGKRWSLAGLGIPGRLSLAAQSVGLALAEFISAQHLNTSGAVTFLSRRGEDAALHYAIYAPGVEATDQIKAMAMAMSLNAMRSLCGPGWHPSEVHLAFREPADAHEYRRHFGVPVRFSSQETALLFPAQWLEQPVPSADQGKFDRLKRAADIAGNAAPGTRVRRAVTAQVLDQRASGDSIAEELSINRRMLSRRLRSEGTSFQKILDEVQFAVACQILQDTDVPGVEIAALFGYSDASGFTRAFRRWSGVTPQIWRQTHRLKGS